MPEGPEVKIITEQLNKFLKGKRILEFNLLSKSKYIKHKPEGYDQFKNNLPLKVLKVDCKGKMIYFILSNGWYIINKLGLSGGWFLDSQKNNDAVELKTSNGNLYFNDPRHFAYFKFIEGEDELIKEIKSLGPDILSDRITPNYFIERLYEKKNLKKPIYEVLSDQSVFSGIGNYLRAEILYASKIDPNKKVESIYAHDALDILKNAKKIMKEAYQHHGASLQSYFDIHHDKGSFQNFMKVYEKKTDPLGNKVEILKTNDNRSLYWVSAIQK